MPSARTFIVVAASSFLLTFPAFSQEDEKKPAKAAEQFRSSGDALISHGEEVAPKKAPEEVPELTPEEAAKKAAADKIARENSLKEQAAREIKMNDPGPACADGVKLEDGTIETGYGFVTTATKGEYVQRFDSKLFPSRNITEVCVCWIRGSRVNKVDFEVVFYEEVNGRPVDEPYAAVKASSEGLPFRKANAGRFFPAAIEGVTIPEGGSYIGVRFNPSVSKQIFVCADQSEGTAAVPGFQREDRAKGWDNMLQSRDWIFGKHRALSIRAVAEKPAADGGDAPQAEDGESSDAE
ncbi:MAG: hypothetical protein AAFY88_03380 [Acidobacteriota bacterium]